MGRRLVPPLLAAVAVAMTGGAAFAIANSVSTAPPPLYVSRTSPSGVADHPDAPPSTAVARTVVTPSLAVTRNSTVRTSTTVPSDDRPAASTPVTRGRAGTVALLTSTPPLEDRGVDGRAEDRGRGRTGSDADGDHRGRADEHTGPSADAPADDHRGRTDDHQPDDHRGRTDDTVHDDDHRGRTEHD
jgi:hypothetical protein